MELVNTCYVIGNYVMENKTIRICLLTFILIFNGVNAQSNDQKSHIHYVWRSLAIPGWGEFSLNEPERGKFFFITESILWIGMGGSFLKSKLEQNTYEAFAREHAGIGLGNKPRQFWIDIGNYNSRSDFIDEHLRWREFDEIEKYADAEWDWNWNSDSNKRYFENKRIQSDRLLLMGKFFIGGIVLNHIISGMDALYLSRKKSKVKFQAFMVPTGWDEEVKLEYNLSIQF